MGDSFILSQEGGPMARKRKKMKYFMYFKTNCCIFLIFTTNLQVFKLLPQKCKENG
jgi:hypothetical protein